MSLDAFENAWFDIPETEENRTSISGNFSNRPKNVPFPEPIPEEKARYVPERYRQRPASEKKPTFILSPCCEWKAQAAKLKRCAILAGDVIWHNAGLEKDQFVKDGRPESKPLKLESHLRKRLGVENWTMSRGIKELEKAGLLRRIEKPPGVLREVVLINVWLIRQRDEHAK